MMREEDFYEDGCRQDNVDVSVGRRKHLIHRIPLALKIGLVVVLGLVMFWFMGAK